MALAQVSSLLHISIHDVGLCSPVRTPAMSKFFFSNPSSQIRTTFATGSPLLNQTTRRGKLAGKAAAISIRCEQSTKEGNSLDVWLGRLAMVGFAAAISIEIATGKGLLENFGLTSPLPTVALAVTVLVGVLTAIFIFQSASKS